MTNPKAVLRWVLLLVVFGSITAYGIRESAGDDSAASPTAPVTQPSAEAVAEAEVVVTYFTTEVRCASCRTIEDLSRRAIAEGFASEVASGRVVYRVIDTDRPEHEHHRDHYELANKTVIVSHQVGGREVDWTNRQDVWLLLDDAEQFFAYVREPVRGYLGED